MRFAALLLTILLGVLAAAGTPQHAAAARQASDRITIIVLDQSGSMVQDAPDAVPPTTASDPHGLRCSAVRLLADLATERDSLGLIRLETSSARSDDLAAQTIVSPPLVMGTLQTREQFKKLVRCDDARHNTPIADALARAYDELNKVLETRAGVPFSGQVLLLTDGAPAPQSERQRMQIADLLPNYATHSWPIHTIGLRLQANGKPEAITLLRSIAALTGGTTYGDVNDPLALQGIFLEFFAQQTGRSLLPGSFRQLSQDDEYTLTVPDYATRIDVLVARNTPGATIELRQPGPSYAPVTDTVQGVDLYSKDDSYYTAFSVERPLPGAWSVRSDRETGVIVNVLIESDISIRLEGTAKARAANTPLLLEARFYTHDASGQMHPAAIQSADVLAQVTAAESVQELRLRDDGKAPDAVANDSLYTGALSPAVTEVYEPVPVAVTLTARTGTAVYNHRATLQLIPVPEVLLTPSAVRLPPDQPIVARLELRLTRRAVALDGWRLVVRQLIGGTSEQRPIHEEGDGYIVDLAPIDDTQRDYEIEADLIGIDQNAGLERLRQPLHLTVDLVPVLRLALDDLGLRPIGQPITVTAALLQGFGRPASLPEPLVLQVERAGAVVRDLPAAAGSQPGVYEYSFTPEQPGAYLLRLLPPPGAAVAPVTHDLTIAAVPELRWDSEVGHTDGLSRRVRSWDGVDGGIYTLLGMRRSEPLTLAGAILRAGQPYTGPLSLELLNASGDLIARAEAQGGQIRIERAIPEGPYQLVSQSPGLFAPQIACCRTVETLQVIVLSPELAEIWVARGQLSGAMSGGLLLLLLARYLWLHRTFRAILPGDRLIYMVEGQERPIDLRAAQGWRHFLWPGHVVLSKDALHDRVYRGKKPRQAIQPLRVHQVRRLGIAINGQPLTASDEQGGAVKILKDGDMVRYAPTRKRLRTNRPQGGRRPPPLRPTRPRRPSSVGLFARLRGLFAPARPRKRRR